MEWKLGGRERAKRPDPVGTLHVSTGKVSAYFEIRVMPAFHAGLLLFASASPPARSIFKIIARSIREDLSSRSPTNSLNCALCVSYHAQLGHE